MERSHSRRNDGRGKMKFIGIVAITAGTMGAYTMLNMEGDQLFRCLVFGMNTGCGLACLLAGLYDKRPIAS